MNRSSSGMINAGFFAVDDGESKSPRLETVSVVPTDFPAPAQECMLAQDIERSDTTERSSKSSQSSERNMELRRRRADVLLPTLARRAVPQDDLRC